MKKQNLIKNMIITFVVFIVTTQSVNANENKLNKFNQKFNNFFKCLSDKIENVHDRVSKFFLSPELLVDLTGAEVLDLT